MSLHQALEGGMPAAFPLAHASASLCSCPALQDDSISSPGAARWDEMLQMREGSAAGPPGGFSIQTSWESTSHLDMMLRESWLVPSSLLWTGQVILSQASKAAQGKQGRLAVNEAAVFILARAGSCNPAHCMPSKKSCYTPTSLMKRDFKSSLYSKQWICNVMSQSNS